MAGRAPRTARGREGPHSPRRRTGPPSLNTALGAAREGLRLRHRRGPEEPGRALRRPLAVARLPLHVRVWLQRHGRPTGLYRLLVRGRSLRRPAAAPERPRRRLRLRVDRAARTAAGLQAPDGLALPVGLLAGQ